MSGSINTDSYYSSIGVSLPAIPLLTQRYELIGLDRDPMSDLDLVDGFQYSESMTHTVYSKLFQVIMQHCDEDITNNTLRYKRVNFTLLYKPLLLTDLSCYARKFEKRLQDLPQTQRIVLRSIDRLFRGEGTAQARRPHLYNAMFWVCFDLKLFSKLGLRWRPRAMRRTL